MLRESVHDFKVALMFLTRLPVRLARPPDAAALAASAPMFPVVGVLVGVLGALVYAAVLRLGLTSFLAATLAIAAQVVATGALHEDGLADVADGLGGADRDDRLRIMRDPTIGAFGALAVTLALLLRLGAFATLARPLDVAAAMVAAAALSRGGLPLAMTLTPTARTDGLAAGAGRPHPWRAAAAAAIAGLIAVLLVPGAALAGIVAAALAGAALVALARRRIGGITGDVLGAVQQVGEVAFLLAVVAAA